MPCPHSNVCLPAAPAEFGILSPHIKFIMHVLFKNLTSSYVVLAYCRFIVDVSSAEVAWPTVEIVPPPPHWLRRARASATPGDVHTISLQCSSGPVAEAVL